MSIECFKYEFEHKKGKRQLYHDFNYQRKKNKIKKHVFKCGFNLKTMHYAFILPWKLKGEKNEAVNLKCKII